MISELQSLQERISDMESYIFGDIKISVISPTLIDNIININKQIAQIVNNKNIILFLEQLSKKACILSNHPQIETLQLKYDLIFSGEKQIEINTSLLKKIAHHNRKMYQDNFNTINASSEKIRSLILCNSVQYNLLQNQNNILQSFMLEYYKMINLISGMFIVWDKIIRKLEQQISNDF
ncbi:unnamed protein product [Gordionus sp. m RMFG-2023]